MLSFFVLAFSFIPTSFFHSRPPQDPYFLFTCLIVSETAAILILLSHFCVFGLFGVREAHTRGEDELFCIVLLCSKTGSHSARHTHACLHTAPHTLGHLCNPSLQPPTGRRSTSSVQDLLVCPPRKSSSSLRPPLLCRYTSYRDPQPRCACTAALEGLLRCSRCMLCAHVSSLGLWVGVICGSASGGARRRSDLEALDVHLLPRPTATLRHHSCTGRPL